jgi:hypothetical protein
MAVDTRATPTRSRAASPRRARTPLLERDVLVPTTPPSVPSSFTPPPPPIPMAAAVAGPATPPASPLPVPAYETLSQAASAAVLPPAAMQALVRRVTKLIRTPGIRAARRAAAIVGAHRRQLGPATVRTVMREARRFKRTALVAALA